MGAVDNYGRPPRSFLSAKANSGDRSLFAHDLARHAEPAEKTFLLLGERSRIDIHAERRPRDLLPVESRRLEERSDQRTVCVAEVRVDGGEGRSVRVGLGERARECFDMWDRDRIWLL